MSKIKDIQSAKIGLSGLLGNPTQTPDNAGGLSPLEDTPLNSKEEIESTLEEETREALQREIQRRQDPQGVVNPSPRSMSV